MYIIIERKRYRTVRVIIFVSNKNHIGVAQSIEETFHEICFFYPNVRSDPMYELLLKFNIDANICTVQINVIEIAFESYYLRLKPRQSHFSAGKNRPFFWPPNKEFNLKEIEKILQVRFHFY